jgi:hypothetical protein
VYNSPFNPIIFAQSGSFLALAPALMSLSLGGLYRTV